MDGGFFTCVCLFLAAHFTVTVSTGRPHSCECQTYTRHRELYISQCQGREAKQTNKAGEEIHVTPQVFEATGLQGHVKEKTKSLFFEMV